MNFDLFLFNLYGAVISFLTVTQTFGSIKSGPCKPGAKRNEEDLRKRFDDYRADCKYSSSFFFHNWLLPEVDHPRFTGRADRTYIYGQRRCPRRLTPKQLSKGLMYRSTCPWYVEMTVNHDRYPTYMGTGRCSCKHCYNGNGTKYINEAEAPMCQEVKRRVPVLRQIFIEDKNNGTQWVPQCKHGVKVYEKHYEDVTVGCICALRSSDETTEPSPKYSDI